MRKVSVECAECHEEVPEEERVGLNGFYYHATPCFDTAFAREMAALRKTIKDA